MDCSSMSFFILFLNPCKYLPSDPAHDRSTANYHLWEETNSLLCSEPATPQFCVVLSHSHVRSDIETSHPINLPQTAQHFSCLFPRHFGLLCSSEFVPAQSTTQKCHFSIEDCTAVSGFIPCLFCDPLFLCSLSTSGLMAAFHGLRGLFQPQQFHDSMDSTVTFCSGV